MPQHWLWLHNLEESLHMLSYQIMLQNAK
ncbi:hypothetical protein M8C21_026229 [Ambrosia artemisiifolia]|uniref:Uncharacterized protein n=1 Tax=Ambrosia artemisiifolia TaxID=4212 RepID=A0AAD5CQR8_AMBAR|nr:hypothetical protein M8C21_026229 [Ambrosia artemisiifolia]